jgi:steroid delta-isomerase-like uncharacterized protein
MAEITQYASFMLRLWRTHRPELSGNANWQSEIQHIQTGQRWSFHTIDALLNFLRQQTEEANLLPISDNHTSSSASTSFTGGNVMPTENKAILRRFFEEIFNQGNLSAADEIVAENYVNHNPAPGETPGREGLKQFVLTVHSGFPGGRFNVEDQIAEGDKVTTRWSFTGTHQAEFAGIPATGKQVQITAINIHRIVDGQIQEGWLNWDALGMMQQLGVIPRPE